MDSRSPRLQLQPAVTDIAPDIRDELKSDLLSISACKAHLEFIVNCVADMRGNNRYFTNTVLQIYGSTIDVKSSASKTFEDPNIQHFVGILRLKGSIFHLIRSGHSSILISKVRRISLACWLGTFNNGRRESLTKVRELIGS